MSTSPGPEPSRGAEGAPPAGARHRARERALGLLYEAESKSEPPDVVIARLPLAPEPYARALAEGVGRRQGAIDELIAGSASGWRLERMPSIDRQVLRIAVFELLERAEVPVAVVLDEAVQLAKDYSTEDSGRFVNGVLAALAPRLRAREADPA